VNTKGTRAMILVAGLLFAVLASSQEKKIKRSDLPPAVEKTVAAQSAGATIKGFSKENEKGQTYYEAEMMVNGHTKDVLIDINGNIVEVEEQVAIDGLPADVKAALQAKAGEGKLVKVETITKKDKLVAYEAQVTKGGKKSEVQVGPGGKPLDHEE
jgi:NAD(P)H-flavin reductase